MQKKLSVFAIATSASLLSLVFAAGNFFNTWQEKIIDRFFLSSKPSEKIIILAIDDESIQKIGQWPWPREIFASTLKNIETAKAIGIDINFSEPSRFGKKDDEALEFVLAELKTKVILPVQLSEDGKTLSKPLPRFSNSEKVKLAFPNFRPDADGVIRKFNRVSGEFISFAGILTSETEGPNEGRIYYKGREKTFLTIPFIDAHEKRIPREILSDAVIIIGATAEDLHDFHETPFGKMPGAEIHANVLNTILEGRFIRESGLAVLFVLALAVNILSAWLILRVHSFSKIALSFISIFVALNIVVLVVFYFDLILAPLYLNLGFLLSSAGLIIFQYTAESKEKRFIRKVFQYYLMPEVVEELMKNPNKIKLGGERKKITVFFSDIRGFTSISETMTPENLAHVINEYLTEMTDVIMEHRGLVDKYIGDAIMAFWGAPLENPESAQNACRATLEMLEKLQKLNLHFKKLGIPELAIGVGLNTGEVFVGNMGSKKRFNYTLMGDEVNFGSRLEGLNKSYGTTCLISESTKKEIENEPELTARELDLITVKGKKEPKKIFELVTRTLDDNFRKTLNHFASGKEHYRNARWKEAIQEFETALSFGNDGPSAAFLERCRYFSENPPENWTGVYEFKTK